MGLIKLIIGLIAGIFGMVVGLVGLVLGIFGAALGVVLLVILGAVFLAPLAILFLIIF